jgi:hypothetical protein
MPGPCFTQGRRANGRTHARLKGAKHVFTRALHGFLALQGGGDLILGGGDLLTPARP